MAEQSSTVVTFRALIMLIPILVPVAAFCGTSFPAVVKAIQSGRWPTLADFRGPAGTPPGQATDAPRFSPLAAAPAPAYSGMPQVPGAVSQGEMSRPAVVPVNYNAPIIAPQQNEFVLPVGTNHGVGNGQGLTPVQPGEEKLLQIDHAAEKARAADLPPAAPSPAGNTPPGDQFNYIQQRLRQLGATYYLLETWGDHKNEFRFYCRMSIGGNPQITRPFWCFDADPLKAMTQVLKQVEDWQSGGAAGARPQASSFAVPPAESTRSMPQS